MRTKTITAERLPARPETTAEPAITTTETWIAALEVAQGILHDATRAPREYVQRLHVEKGGE